MAQSVPRHTHDNDTFAALRLPEYRLMIVSRLFSGLAMSMLVVVVGYQVYDLTREPLALGWLGLIAAIPALSLSLVGGHFADRHDRRRILLITGALLTFGALALAAVSTATALNMVLAGIFGVTFMNGIAAGFSRPAASAFDAQVAPLEYAVNANAWSSSVTQAAGIIGPALGGFAYALFGVTATYGAIAVLNGASVVLVSRVKAKPLPPPPVNETTWQSLVGGVRYVFGNQILVGAMTLDLFAVLFGGAIAMLPVFASDILGVGPAGLGLLRAAPSVGALLVMLLSTRFGSTRHAGRNLLACVAGFGASMIVFGLSTTFWLSLVAMFFSGLFDGVSMVIRFAITRILSPEQLRGRIAAVNWIFIGASNELGAFESGVAATLLGVVPSVVLGGVVTLGVVAAMALGAPKLSHLNLDVERKRMLEMAG